MTYFIYILQCNDGSYYTGSTDNLKRRINAHKTGYGPSYTRKRLPVKLAYYESFNNLVHARRREKQIKGWSRKKKINLIQYKHPVKTNKY